jgi:hypothetical protein
MSEEVDTEVQNEKPVRKHDDRFWKKLSFFLSLCLAGSALLGVVVPAFYVTRSEYTRQTKEDAVTRENMRLTLENLNRTLNLQAEAFRDMTDRVQTLTDRVHEVKVSLAVVQRKTLTE